MHINQVRQLKSEKAGIEESIEMLQRTIRQGPGVTRVFTLGDKLDRRFYKVTEADVGRAAARVAELREMLD